VAALPQASRLNSYLIAIVAVAVSAGVRYLLDPILGAAIPYTLFFPAIALVAFTGSLGAAVFASLLAAVAANVLFIAPRLTVSGVRAIELIGLATFLISGGIISVLAHRLKKQQRDLTVIADSAETHRRELQVERTRLQNLVSSIPGVVWEAWGEPGSPTQRMGFVSKYAEKMLGYTTQEWLSTPNFWLNVVAPEDREKAAVAASQKFTDTESGGNEFRWITKDGRRLWVMAQSTTVTDDRGRPIGMRGVTFDITPRKEAELRVELLAGISAESPAETTLEQLAQSIAQRTTEVVGECCVVRVVENGELRAVGAAHESPDVLPLLQAVLDLPELAGDSTFFRTMLDSPRTMRFDDIPALAKRVELAPVTALLNRFPARAGLVVPLMSQGRLVGTMSLWRVAKGAFSDAEVRLIEAIAGRAALLFENRKLFETAKRDAAEARHAREEAERANQVKDEFLGTLSHELRTPLNAILGWAHMLRDPRMTEDRRHAAVETIVRNAQSQEQLISDILDVQRIMSGKIRLNLRPVDLGNVIRAAAETVQPAADAKRIRLQLLLDLDVPSVQGDAERLQQVVWNLLSNAIKFTPAGGRVEVRLLRHGSDCELIVEDTGPGISADFLPYVFDRFRQADSSTTRTHRGLGLGLSIVRSLIEMHGGTIEANNVTAADRTGASFTLRLPRQGARPEDVEIDVDAAMEHAARLSGEASMLSDVHVLVVEDDTDARELVAEVLQRCGAHVVTAASATEGMEAFRQRVPDVLVSDIEMPQEDGYSFIRKIRELPADKGGRVPAAALTAYASTADRMRVLSAGFNIHLAKPVQPAELAVVVANLAGRTVMKSS
jgi:PAS domain S-box-containing protein